ncbi:hypothetical protein P280DRAFT_44371 [Massarina eburnea CBS 473.64]|uniref:Uncharacterized protein n=1 Tax=Massarina eburnea CBS 473.64 TaxID=1395130 RepID=A0A6A6RY07_9PLEO|nr:hypothetical protein P280DRAFT_44371 [Massarina eburnea CBS 473.64]
MLLVTVPQMCSASQSIHMRIAAFPHSHTTTAHTIAACATAHAGSREKGGGKRGDESHTHMATRPAGSTTFTSTVTIPHAHAREPCNAHRIRVQHVTPKIGRIRIRLHCRVLLMYTVLTKRHRTVGGETGASHLYFVHVYGWRSTAPLSSQGWSARRVADTASKRYICGYGCCVKWLYCLMYF